MSSEPSSVATPPRTILVSGHFGRIGRDAKLDYFSRLNRALSAQGLCLFMLNMNGNRLPKDLRGESFPFWVEKSHWLPLDRLIPAGAIHLDMVQAAGIDAACWDRSPARESIRLLLFREHLRRVVARERPCLHIAWHQFYSFHYSLPAMLEALGVPLLFTEFGPLPGTIIFDRKGQMAESPIVERSDEFSGQPVSELELRGAEAFLERVRSERRTRKPQAKPGRVRDALLPHRAASQKVIFYAGQYDHRTGMLPRTLPNARLHSPFFADTLDALSFLSRLAKKNDWLILFKPHPLAQHSEESLSRIAEPDRVVSVPGANIFECFEYSQAVSTLVSQVSYMGLVHRQPCVMLGRNYLTGKGCAYEPASLEDIEPEMQKALANGLTAQQEAHWKRHVAQLLKSAVFAFDGDLDVPSLRGTEDTALFLAEMCVGDGLQKLARPFATAQSEDVDPHFLPTLNTLYSWVGRVDPVFSPLRGRL